jgi:hypothetical protein
MLVISVSWTRLPVSTEQTMLRRCLVFGLLDDLYDVSHFFEHYLDCPLLNCCRFTDQMLTCYCKFYQVVELKAFNKFENTLDALSAATLLIDSKPSKGLRKFLQKHCDGETLAVADSKLGNAIKEKLVRCRPWLFSSLSHAVIDVTDRDDIFAEN